MTEQSAMPPSLDGVNAEPSSSFAAVPDAFQRLWTPHRMAYIDSHHRVSDERAQSDDPCPFCVAPSRDDESALIVARGAHAYVLLNLFPYASGHLLVCPYRHVSTYDLATHDEVAEIAALTQTAMRVLKETSHCEGFNIGMNQGRIAGAGIAEHLHQHVVPRWSNDSNFMPIIAGVKTMPQLLSRVRTEIARAWPSA